MSRARRLSEIAKANQPVFSSTNGSHWWLADPSPKGDPESAPPSKDPEPQPAPVGQIAVALQDSKSENPAVPLPAQATILLQQPEPVPHQAEPQAPSNGAVSAQPEPASRDLASRLSSLKDRFLWLGRRNRTAEPE